MKINCIFFDFDGVLAESVDIKTQAFYKMYLPYGKDFAEKVKKHHINNGGISRFEKFKIYNGQWLQEEINSERINSLADQFSKMVVQGVIESPEVIGAKEFLENSKAYKMFIITGTPTEEIKEILIGRKMESFFDGIFGSPEKKSFWVDHVLNTHNISSENCVFIGDAMADYEAAKQNNIEFILRETLDGEAVFRDYKGTRIKNLKTLKEEILKIK